MSNSMFSDDEVPFHCLPWRERYKRVLASERWKTLRKRLIATRKACERCGFDVDLDLHHLNYDRLGSELDTDVELVCRKCHPDADEERAERGRKKSSKALRNARFKGWAAKRYGEDWEQRFDHEQVWNNYQDWLERQ